MMLFVFFKQKTAYEVRISDWSSDVCSSDLDLVLVVGSPNSSNSNRLRELAQREGVEAYLIDGAIEIDPKWVVGRQHIGVTAGAPAPEVLVRGRSEERRVGTECVMMFRYRWSPYSYIKHTKFYQK